MDGTERIRRAAVAVHIILCLGCGQSWAETPGDPDSCSCTCTDSGDPLYESWAVVTDPFQDSPGK
jgi:hypothetical protein